MALTTTTANGLLRPESVNQLVVRPVSQMSVAYQICQPVVINTNEHRFPIWTRDPQAAWVAERQEIPIDDPITTELVVSPKTCAGLTVISRQLASDSLNPGAQEQVGQSIARDISRTVDRALFATTTPPEGPAGLGTLAGVSEVELDDVDDLKNLDPFVDAISLANQEGAAITHWVANPALARRLAKLKVQDGSNQPLLQPDPTLPTRRQVFGIPLLESPELNNDTIWGVPWSVSHLVQHEDVVLEYDKSAFITSLSIAIVSALRVAFGFPHPKAVVKITVPDWAS